MSRQPWAEVELVLERNGIANPRPTTARLQRFVELLVQWNRSVSNLISKNDEDRVVAAHVLPSIEVVGWMKSHDLARWCDLGSGGGFPAIPLALCGVGEAWDLVESRRTKSLFLQRAVQVLELPHVRVLSARIEDLLADLAARSESPDPSASSRDGEGEEDDGWGAEHREPEAADEPRPPLNPPYDGFTSRATLTLGPTLEYAGKLVRPDGRAFLWKGSRLAAEAAEHPAWRAHWSESESRPLSIEHSVVASFQRHKE